MKAVTLTSKCIILAVCICAGTLAVAEEASMQMPKMDPVFDRDADGLADAIDPAPDSNDGDCYGQSDAWVRASFTNAEEILAVGYRQWVLDKVGSGLQNGYYMLEVTFTNTPPQPVNLVLGGWSVVVTNADTLVFLCEKCTRFGIYTNPFYQAVKFDSADDVDAKTGRPVYYRSPDDSTRMPDTEFNEEFGRIRKKIEGFLSEADDFSTELDRVCDEAHRMCATTAVHVAGILKEVYPAEYIAKLNPSNANLVIDRNVAYISMSNAVAEFATGPRGEQSLHPPKCVFDMQSMWRDLDKIRDARTRVEKSLAGFRESASRQPVEVPEHSRSRRTLTRLEDECTQLRRSLDEIRYFGKDAKDLSHADRWMRRRGAQVEMYAEQEVKRVKKSRDRRLEYEEMRRRKGAS